ncbi:MAG: glycosyltransferase family 2 protein [Patescibacteria group bacterium]
MAENESPDLSIIILNFNVRDLLLKCLDSIFKNKKVSDKWQIIVVDNASSDGSVEAVKEKYKIASSPASPDPRNDNVELIASKSNLGFAAGNNKAIPKIKAPVVLFLNPDTEIVGDAINKSLKFLKSNPDIGALTCRVELPDGRLDYSCHRGFPTPWNAFCYFSGLSKLFPKWSLFSGYTASHLDIRTTHEIDCLTGAFLMVRKIAGDQINWWDEDYFFNGEDIEFCYNLKEKGWKVYYFADAKIIHYKGSSTGIKKTSAFKVDKSRKLKVVGFATSAMRIFYMKHYFKKYPPLLRNLVLLGIKFLEHFRKVKVMVS